MKAIIQKQRQICKKYGAPFDPPPPETKVGIALQTLSLSPINGMRAPAMPTTCGWFIYGGEDPSSADDFYQPLCWEHLEDRCKSVLPFLALPPGWRFLTDGAGYVDVWFDEQLLR